MRVNAQSRNRAEPLAYTWGSDATGAGLVRGTPRWLPRGKTRSQFYLEAASGERLRPLFCPPEQSGQSDGIAGIGAHPNAVLCYAQAEKLM